jgi:hypothetical protein
MPANLRPVIGSFLPGADPVNVGAALNLWARDVTDPDSNVRAVAFYEESNGVAGLQTGIGGGDHAIGNGTRSLSDWSIAVNTVGRLPRTYVFYAVATDNGFARSVVVSTAANVQ